MHWYNTGVYILLHHSNFNFIFPLSLSSHLFIISSLELQNIWMQIV